MPDSRTDAELARGAASGQRSSFEELVRRHQGTVFRICMRILKDEGDAGDAAQEAFLKAFRNLTSFDASRAFAPWLYRIARNHALDVARHRGLSVEVLEREDPDDEDGGTGAVGRDTADESPDALTQLEGAEVKKRIASALSALDVKYREPIELFHFEGLTYDEIASTLGVPIGTVMTRIHRGRARLAEALQTMRT